LAWIDPESEFERVGCLPLEGAQVVTIARQTGVNGTPRGKTLAAEGGFSANLTQLTM
jgi:hypothetical protein